MAGYRVKGIKKYRDRHGRLRCYHRKTGRPILAEYGTVAFLRELEAIEKELERQKERGAIPGTLGAVIKSYQATPHFLDLAKTTRDGYARYMRLMAEFGETPLASITPGFLAELRDGLAEDRGRRSANYFLAVMSVLFEFAIERGWTKANPVTSVKRLKRDKNRQKANRPWTLEERRTVLDAAPWHVKVPIALAMFTGMRKGDCLTVTKAALKGEVINTSKTGEEVFVHIHPDLQRILDEAPAHNALTIAANSEGKPWTVDGFNTVWMRLRDRLEAEGRIGPGLTIHGLRHTVGTLLAEAGTGLDDIRRALGQKTLGMAQHYSERAKKQEAARGIIHRLDPLGRRKVSNLSGESV